jgi:hypothetical protein
MISERFAYSEFEIEKRVDSKIRKGHVHTVTVGFRCPRCEHENRPLSHGGTTACDKCRLKMVLHGNHLQCTAMAGGGGDE